MLVSLLFQYMGAFFGILITYLLAKNFESYELAPRLTPGVDSLYYFDDLTPKFARFIMPEVLQTFTFVLVYLVLSFDREMKRLDRIIKGFFLALTVALCLTLGYGSCATMNPA